MAPPTVRHSRLGTTFCGVKHPLSSSEAEIWHFRGIRYGSIPERFRRPKLFTSYRAQTDATRYGPVCPQSKRSVSEEQVLFGLQPDQIPKMALDQDEYECLNLNIFVPASIKPNARLPVMFWIHGGANIHGSGANWIMDAGALVRKSMLQDEPVIVVSCNYRLGLFGFAASPLLLEDNRKAGEPGVGNYGLYDQRLAMEWVHSFIGPFGGDPNNITAFGVSAGALDIHAHLLSNAHARKPIIKRAIIQSGVITTLPTVWSQGATLTRIMSALQISTIDELRDVEPDRLVRLAGGRVAPTDDGVFFRSDWKNGMLPPDSPTDIMIGDCGFESALWRVPAGMWTYEGVSRRIRAIVRNIYKAETLLRSYDVYAPSFVDDHEEDEEDDLAERILDIINDAAFAYPTYLAASGARSSGSKVYQYVFDQASPISDLPHHGVDVVYLFDNVPVPDRDEWNYARVRNAMQERWIAFANGDKPWRDDRVYVFGPEGEIGERGWSTYQCRRRTQAWHDAFAELDMEVVQRIAQELGNGPPSDSRARY